MAAGVRFGRHQRHERFAVDAGHEAYGSGEPAHTKAFSWAVLAKLGRGLVEYSI